MPFSFEQLPLDGLVLIKPRVFEDERGYFMETYKESEFASAGIRDKFVQGNLSFSRKGVLRGIHYQEAPRAQAKLVRVLEGEIFDVVVDIRPQSPSFGRWQSVLLSAENKHSLYVPSWFAHGFCVLSDTALVLYDVNAEYSPEHERGIPWDDPTLDIAWPVKLPIVSERDRTWPGIAALKP